MSQIPSVGYSEVAPTISALKAIPGYRRTTGYCLLVPEIKSWVVYLETSTDTPNNVSIFIPDDGIGRWVVTNTIAQDTLVYVGVAAESISALRGVTLNPNNEVILANPNTPSLLGLSLTGANVGNNVTVVLSGRVTDTSWDWGAGKTLFISNDGIVVSNLPVTPYLLVIGKAINSNTITVQKETYKIL